MNRLRLKTWVSWIASSLFLLAFPVIAAAAQTSLASGHVPAVVAEGKIAPLGRLAGTNQMRLAIALPLRNAGELTNLLRAIYDPTSPQYHHYLKPAEFIARFNPTPADYAAVEHFARTNGFTIVGRQTDRLLVDVTGKASDVEKAFHVQLNTYRHPREKRNFFAPDTEPKVDGALAILRVSGLDNYALPHPQLQRLPVSASGRATPQGGSGPQGGLVGNDFRQAYVPGTTLTGAGQNVALLQFDGFYPVDITNYANDIGLSNLPPINVINVDGGVSTPGGGDDEVSLDIEMLLAMAPGISNIYVYEAPNPSPWTDLLSQMANDDLAQQVSCSWSGGGPDTAAEQYFIQMAAQGQTFFNASGDTDAFTAPIEFPSESPNITQVGGTTLTTDTNGNYVAESVWNWGVEYGPFDDGKGSSGGISTDVPIPPWQLGTDMTANNGSTVMRNIPDVALTADNIYIEYGYGTNELVGGTSCAAPLWAAFTALVNEQATGLGQPAVGFLNPAIYGLCRGTNYGTTFNDITNGNNTSFISPTKYYAVPGYDLCTGWGTPAGTNLINALTMPDGLLIVTQVFYSTSVQVGGPFTPTGWNLILTNTGLTSLDWALGNAPAWLTVSAESGTLAANDSTNIVLQLTGAEELPAGQPAALLMVTNLDPARVQAVLVQLDIGGSIVQNGGFETGDFTGWTLVGDTVMGQNYFNAVVTEGQFPGTVHSGNYGAFLGEGGYLATLSQTLPTVSNQLYQLSFWLSNPTSLGTQQFMASWDGVAVLNLTNPPVLSWTNFQFVVTAADTNVFLQFAAENDANYFGLDDVTVMPVPPVGFGSATVNGSDLNLTWNSLSGLNYEVDETTNLVPAYWQSLATITTVTNIGSYADTNALNAAGQRFYRLLLLP